MSAPPLSTPVGRWAGFGPYYAMFPVDFAFDTVSRYCPEGGKVFDPFAGRGTSIYAAAAQGRRGLGIELNPVGWVYSRAKLKPASQKLVLKRLHEIGRLATLGQSRPETRKHWAHPPSFEMPEFFHWCYTPRVLQFLLTARRQLRWQTNQTDRTLMAILMVYLHAKSGSGISNQMRQSKSMSPDYAIRWWRQNGTQPPDIDPVAWLEERIIWRYSTGLPELEVGEILLADSTKRIERVSQILHRGHEQPFDLLLTSPPYFAVTGYRYEQWLRLWLLGASPYPVAAGKRAPDRYSSKTEYFRLLKNVFIASARVMSPRATIYIRTDARAYALIATKVALCGAFPGRRIEIEFRPVPRSQTILFGNKSSKLGEVDIIVPS